MDVLSVKIPSELAQRLNAAAKARKMSKSAIVHEALEAYFMQGPTKGKITCYDLVSDLAGSCEGPEDLATNKKYMEGFGR